MAEFPALPLWTDAYIADTQHLTNEEHGVYLRLLMFAWRSPSCSLPDNDKRLAIMVGVTPKVWARLKPTVMSFWSLKDGEWTQKKLTAQRDFVEANRKQKSAAGKASARAKALKNNDTGSTAVATEAATEPQRDGNNHTHTHIQENPSDSSTGAQDEKKPESEKKKTVRGTRLSPDWQLSEDDYQFAVNEGLQHDEITRTADEFRDYWIGVSGQKGTKRDWSATWRNRVRAIKDRRGNSRNAGASGPHEALFAGFERSAIKNSRGEG